MRVVGQNRDLPSLPGPGWNADRLQHDGQQASGYLFARSYDGVIFACVVEHVGFAHPAHELIGCTSHRRNDNSHLVTGIDLAFDMARNVANALHVRDGRTAEFHYQDCHAFNRSRTSPHGLRR